MIVKIYRADRQIEIFKTDNYIIGKAKDFHPIIYKVEVFTEAGKRIAKRSRHFVWYYKHVTFKTKAVQDKLLEIQKQQTAE